MGEKVCRCLEAVMIVHKLHLVIAMIVEVISISGSGSSNRHNNGNGKSLSRGDVVRVETLKS